MLNLGGAISGGATGYRSGIMKPSPQKNMVQREAVALLALGEEIAAKAAIAAPGFQHSSWLG
jgi:hypothetical protein